MRSVVVLGATGSIGLQTLEAAERLGMPVAGLAARRSGDQLAELADRFPQARIAAVEPDPSGMAVYEDLFGDRCCWGMEAVVEMASQPGCVVVNGIVGAAGLEASMAALEAGNRLALANKESLVAGGPLVTEAARRGGGELIPVDSEHSALFQCLAGERTAEVDRLILTASGGPFRGFGVAELAGVGAEQALAHPTWRMGPRITVDSATLVNKGLEVIEAHFLFGLGYDRIEVVVHPQSIVHSMASFVDGSIKAHLGPPDMRIPIRYALTYPERAEFGAGAEPFDLTRTPLTFEPVDRKAFPGLDLAYAAGREGGVMPAAFNAADEAAAAAFLAGRIGFLDITGVIAEVLEGCERMEAGSLAAVLAADREARRLAEDAIERCRAGRQRVREVRWPAGY